jgi:EmrB/QacA subfamily drug resistance transporter
VDATPTTATGSPGFAGAPQRQRLVGFALGSVLAALMVTLLLSALDQTIVGTALPTIIAELNGVNNYTWVVTAYLLTSTTVIPVVSKLSDQFGRKWLLIGAVFIFLVGSALSGASQTMGQLIAFRALQGVGGGALATLVFTLVGDIFVPAERARWQGLFSGVFGLASVIGPALGGWITDNSSWRWIFYVNLPLGILALVLIFFYLPANISIRSNPSGRSVWARIDWGGAFTSAAATILLLLGLTWGGATYPWNSWQVIGSLSAAGVLFIAFVIAELNAREPILPLDLFKNQVFASGALMALMIGVTLFSVVIYLPVFLQGVLGVKATNSGLVVTPLVVSLAIAAALIGFVVARVGRYQFIAISGAVVITAGFYLLSRMSINTTQQTVVYYMIVLGIGLGLMQPVMTLAVQNAIPQNRLGAGTGAVTYLRTLGSALGAALMGAIVTNAAETDLAPRLANIPNSARLMDGLRSATGTLTNSQALQPLLTDHSLSDQVRAAAVHGANTSPQAQQAVQTAITQAQNSPQTQQAIQAAVAQATAHIPAHAPNRDQLIADATQQITQSVYQTIANKVPTLVHQAITSQVTSVYNDVLEAGRHALAAGIHAGYVFSVGAGVVIIIIALFMKDVPLRGAPRANLAEGAEVASAVSEAEIATSEPPVLALNDQRVEGSNSATPDIGSTPAFGVEGAPGV